MSLSEEERQRLITSFQDSLNNLSTIDEITTNDVPEAPFIDPFSIDKIIGLEWVPLPGLGETRWYYYFHRSSGHMMLQYGHTRYELPPNGLTTIEINTYSVAHDDKNLKCIVAGNAKRIYYDGNKAVLS